MHKKYLALFILVLSSLLAAQEGSLLKPPKGSQLALIVFEDLQCPQCSRANPVLEKASAAYRIPLVRYDFPLPMHNWSFDAAVMARYFDTKSEKLGDSFRDYIFQHQMEITPPALRGFADKFAAENKAPLPFVVDPKGELAAKILADRNFGQRVGIDHTPTIYVVSSKPGSKPVVEVKDLNQLYQTIEAVKH